MAEDKKRKNKTKTRVEVEGLSAAGSDLAMLNRGSRNKGTFRAPEFFMALRVS